MALTRFNGNVVPFASESTTDNRTVFGDVVQADDIDSNLNADFKKGWEIVGLNDNPTKQDFNAMGYTLGALTSYLYQMGIAEYNASQEYKLNAVCIGTDGTIYQSLVDANIGNALNNGTKWKNVTESYVTLTGNQTIAGVKTFSSTISGNINGSATSATTLSSRGGFPNANGEDFNDLITTGVYYVQAENFSGTLNSPGSYGTLFVQNASPFVSQIHIHPSTGALKTRCLYTVANSWTPWMENVNLTIDQTISGVKTFSSSPIVPTPTSGNQAVNKGYVDNSIALKTIATGTATFSATTNNINLTGIGIGVEIGDVIQISGADDAKNNSEFTVEVITDNNNIIVNQAHANKGTTKNVASRASDTGVTVKLLAKWYNAPLGLGQDWVDVTASRSTAVYPNNTNRTIAVEIEYETTWPGNRTLYINENAIDTLSISSTVNMRYKIGSKISKGNNYNVSTYISLQRWKEYR